MNKLTKPVNKGKILLSIARSSISEALGQDQKITEPDVDTGKDSAWLQKKGACFVTLTKKGQLRGCIGSLEARRSLLEDIKSNAKAAAFKDTRFSPLTSEELNDTEIEISLLSAMKALSFSNEQEALAQLRPEVDGVVFEYRHYRSTFLPQVWQQLPDTKDFMAHLKQKAGVNPDFWSDEIKLSRYTVSKWKEHDLDEQIEEPVK